MRRLNLLRISGRVLALSTVTSLVGCSLGLLLKVPVGDLGIVVAVPAVTLFLITRVMIAVVANAAKTRQTGVDSLDIEPCLSLSSELGLGGLFFGLILTVTFLVSAPIYVTIGVPEYRPLALQLSELCGMAAVLGALAIGLEQWADSQQARAFFAYAGRHGDRLLCRLISIPCRLWDSVLSH